MQVIAPPTCNPATDSPAFTPITRLSRIEYNNSLKDVTAIASTSTHPAGYAADLPSDTTTNEGYSSFAGVQIFTYTHASEMFDNAEALAARLATRTSPGILGTACNTSSVTVSQAQACAQPILASLASKAYRRVLTNTSQEVTSLVGIVTGAMNAGDSYDVGMQTAITAALYSPYFLYHLELDPPIGVAAPNPMPSPNSVRSLTNAEIASRLSYFLWNSGPDQTLLNANFQGSDWQTVIDTQLTRMLADPKASSFLTDFPSSWLGLSRLDTAPPDTTAYPTFTTALKDAMKTETLMFFDDAVKNGRLIPNLLDSNTTFVNATLAPHYGISGVLGSSFRSVTLPSNRGGLLGQASILTATSHANESAPVKRGVYILNRILCDPVGAPPANIGDLEDVAVPENAPMRTRLAAHRADPICAGCHDRIDPIGLALDNYNGIGAYRVDGKDRFGNTIDTSGVYGGAAFSDAISFSQALKQDSKFTTCVSRNIASYGLRRLLNLDERGDSCAMSQLKPQNESSNTIRDLIRRIAQSEAFRKRRIKGD